jgi:hypothetical protein
MLTHTETVKTFLTMRETRGRLFRYMSSIGYTAIGTDTDVLFERGSGIGRIPGSPPRAWPMRVFAHLSKTKNGSQVLLRWEIRSGGRIMSIWDVGYFRKEIQGALKTVAAKHVNLNELETAHTTSALYTLLVYVGFFLMIGVTGVLMATGDLSVTFLLLSLLMVATLFMATRAPLVARTHRKTAKQSG